MDKSMLGDLDALPEEDKQRMSSMIEQLQIRDRFRFSIHDSKWIVPLPRETVNN
ncbi:protein transporter tim9 [Orobanche gracilis]